MTELASAPYAFRRHIKNTMDDITTTVMQGELSHEEYIRATAHYRAYNATLEQFNHSFREGDMSHG